MNLLPERTTHQRFGWKAEVYFTDPKVIALCRAIEANDLAEMERLVTRRENRSRPRCAS